MGFRRIVRDPQAERELADALSSLGRLAQERVELAPLAELRSDLLQATFGVPSRESPPSIDLEIAQARLAAGLPILVDEVVEPDRRAFDSRIAKIGDVLAQRSLEQGAALKAAMKRRRLDFYSAAQELIGGHFAAIDARTDAAALNCELVRSALLEATRPAMAKIAQILNPLFEGKEWGRGYCPVCGHEPLLAEEVGLEQRRSLRCSLCATAWPVAREFCPRCENRDYRTLGVLAPPDGRGGVRLATCEKCGGSIKVVTALEPATPPGLLVVDLATCEIEN